MRSVTKEMRKKHNAFTLIELLFVIIAAGVLAAVGTSLYKTNHLRNDANFIAAKIKQAQYRGIGFEHNGFGTEETTADLDNGCILLNAAALEETAGSGEAHYTLHATLSGELANATLCFDSKGRPHLNDFTSATLLREQKVLTLTQAGKDANISIMPMSGYAIIGCN